MKTIIALAILLAASSILGGEQDRPYNENTYSWRLEAHGAKRAGNGSESRLDHVWDRVQDAVDKMATDGVVDDGEKILVTVDWKGLGLFRVMVAHVQHDVTTPRLLGTTLAKGPDARHELPRGPRTKGELPRGPSAGNAGNADDIKATEWTRGGSQPYPRGQGGAR